MKNPCITDTWLFCQSCNAEEETDKDSKYYMRETAATYFREAEMHMQKLVIRTLKAVSGMWAKCKY